MPLPSAASATKFKEVATATVDAAKLKVHAHMACACAVHIEHGMYSSCRGACRHVRQCMLKVPYPCPQAFAEAYGPTINALPKTEAAICLPG